MVWKTDTSFFLLQGLAQLENVHAIEPNQRIKDQYRAIHVHVDRDQKVCFLAPWIVDECLILTDIGSCTCERASDGGLLPGEIDFTGKA